MAHEEAVASSFLPDDRIARAILLVCITLISYYVFTYLQSPLRRVPGPLLASFTDLWRVGSWWTGRSHLTQIQLHRQIGRAVRMGPNMISISDPTLISTIYSSTNPWIKVRGSRLIIHQHSETDRWSMQSDMYSSNDVVVNGVKTSNVFATTDHAWHTKMVKPLRNMGTITKTLVNCEAAVDDTIRLFCSKIDKTAEEGATVPMEKWLLYCMSLQDMMSQSKG